MKLSKNVRLGVSNHCVTRFLERVKNFDFTALKLQFILENRIPSLRYVVDKDFIKWVNATISVDSFREEIEGLISLAITPDQLNKVLHEPKETVRVRSGDNTYVITNRTVVTMLKENRIVA